MGYQITRPDADQLKFTSSKTGDWVLEDYLQAAEYGNFTLAQLLAKIFDPDGAVLPNPYVAVPAHSVFFENDSVVATNSSITPGKNAMSAGPISINAGFTVTVPSNSVWTIV